MKPQLISGRAPTAWNLEATAAGCGLGAGARSVDASAAVEAATIKPINKNFFMIRS